MNDFPFTLPEPDGRDWTAHNAASRALWAAFARNEHARVPIRLNTNPRVIMLDPAYNPRGVSYGDCLSNPDLLGGMMLAWQFYARFLLPADHEKGLPDEWPVWVHLDNIYDAAWFGCPVEFRDGQVPDAVPILDDGQKNRLFDHGLPEPFGGEWATRAQALRDGLDAKAAAGWTFHGRPVRPQPLSPFAGTDGPMTAAVSLRGAENFCMDLLADPDYARALLDFVTEALIRRMTAWREALGIPVKQDAFGFGDDACLFISTETYREFVLPCHRRLYAAFSTGEAPWIHLCGNAQHHFKTIRDELDIRAFDTGFPMDFDRFREELGPEVTCSGGPRVPLFLEEDSGPLLAETGRILRSRIVEGGRFILQEGNNLAPCARLSHCEEFYTLGRELGRLPA